MRSSYPAMVRASAEDMVGPSSFAFSIRFYEKEVEVDCRQCAVVDCLQVRRDTPMEEGLHIFSLKTSNLKLKEGTPAIHRLAMVPEAGERPLYSVS